MALLDLPDLLDLLHLLDLLIAQHPGVPVPDPIHLVLGLSSG